MQLPFFLMSVRHGTIEKIDIFELFKINFCEEPPFLGGFSILNGIQFEYFLYIFRKGMILL